MKHYLIAFSFVFGLMFLSCDDTEASFLNETNAADSLGTAPDSITLIDTTYIVVDSIYFPIDSVGTVVIDSITFNS